MYDQFYCSMNSIRQPLLRFTQTILQTPSPTFQEERLAGKIEECLKQFGHGCFSRDEVGNVIWIVAGAAQEPTLLLASHMDTPHPSGEMQKDSGLFSDRPGKSRMHGLGASGGKSGLAAQIFAAHLLSKLQPPRSGNLVVAATVAGTKGCGMGIRHLLETTLPRMGLRSTAAIIGKPTHLGLYHGFDGWADLELRVTGSRPGARQEFIHWLYNEHGCGNQKNGLARGVPRMFFRRCFHEVGNRSEAVFRLSCRLYPGQTAKSCLSRIKKCLEQRSKGNRSVVVDIQVHGERERLYAGTDNSLLDRARNALRAAGWKNVIVKPWQLGSPEIGTLGNLLVNVYHIPTIAFGPGEKNHADPSKESVAIDELFNAVYGTAVISCALLGWDPRFLEKTVRSRSALPGGGRGPGSRAFPGATGR